MTMKVSCSEHALRSARLYYTLLIKQINPNATALPPRADRLRGARKVMSSAVVRYRCHTEVAGGFMYALADGLLCDLNRYVTPGYICLVCRPEYSGYPLPQLYWLICLSLLPFRDTSRTLDRTAPDV